MTEREIALIKSAQQGDTKAFGELAAAYDQKVMNLALSLVGSVDDARDIYQEVFTKVFKSLKNYQFKSAFYTWLYRIVVNTCLTYRKSRSRRQEMTPVSVEGNPETLATIAEDKAYESDADLMRSEREYQVRCAIDTLP
nr:sigma-70 family RNA polymerase sigma factor [FCB group bacterium]